MSLLVELADDRLGVDTERHLLHLHGLEQLHRLALGILGRLLLALQALAILTLALLVGRAGGRHLRLHALDVALRLSTLLVLEAEGLVGDNLGGALLDLLFLVLGSHDGRVVFESSRESACVVDSLAACSSCVRCAERDSRRSSWAMEQMEKKKEPNRTRQPVDPRTAHLGPNIAAHLQVGMFASVSISWQQRDGVVNGGAANPTDQITSAPHGLALPLHPAAGISGHGEQGRCSWPLA